INQWTKEQGKTVIAVLHDLNLVQMFSEEVIMIKDGQVVASGLSKDVLDEERLLDVYGINIKNFMLEALEKWR
ncbi:ABC transporter ATP-binding protein, partial [Turicibacter sanguinis]|nr:ABC transporter ATP-binding protein [Turicibacter sanguinis]